MREIKMLENQSSKITRSFDNSKIIKPFSVSDVPQHALVIGNANYEYAALTNPVNDATDVAQRLEKMGFNVDKALNLNQVAMGKTIRAFTTRLSQEPGLGLFYFAGHGFQVDGENYLLPIDNKKIEDKHDLEAYAFNVNLQIFNRMEEARNHLNFIILDACRNNPFRGAMRSHQQGLASVNPVMGSIIAFATAPGKTAADKSQCGHNGLFTKYLLEGLEYAEKHNQRVEDMFMQVRNSVLEESGGDQIPWYTASLMKPFHFGKIQSKPEPKPQENEPVRKIQPEPKPKESKPGDIFRDTLKDGSKSPEMVIIPAGKFRMGDIQGTGGDREKPVHEVSVKSFAMGRYLVTVGEFKQFVQAIDYKTEAEKGDGAYVWKDSEWKKIKDANWRNPYFPQKDNQPVVCVSWNDAMAYVKWLSEQTGQQYSLPTEAQWEYAARAGTETDYWWGNEIGKNKANCRNSGSQWSGKQTSPVGSFEANPFGIYDTVGNVWGWIADSWHEDYTNAPNDDKIWAEGADKSYRVLRGGSWSDYSYNSRVADRYRGNPDDRDNSGGFRVVRCLAART
ncbi:SUMF1/EgtB/PvdO family nonheme iron enzyme [Thiotrichales bacterium HSG14]|nr:SUMF1/EgtB/PvdO family nonheme iron enzyme [Thiotrichales bacterium HSG14]